MAVLSFISVVALNYNQRKNICFPEFFFHYNLWKFVGVCGTVLCYQAEIVDVLCILVPSTIFTALHMHGFTSVSFFHFGTKQ
jgi:hypothetical protein